MSASLVLPLKGCHFALQYLCRRQADEPRPWQRCPNTCQILVVIIYEYNPFGEELNSPLQLVPGQPMVSSLWCAEVEQASLSAAV